MKKTSLNQWTGKYEHLQSLEIKRYVGEDGRTECTVILGLDSDALDGQCRYSQLKFFGVKDFKLGNIDWPSTLLICVTDISKDQMEGIKYKVKEDENEQFSFYCENFEFEVLASV